MPNVKQYLFGPGSLESIHLKMWTARLVKGHKNERLGLPDTPDARKIKFTAQGIYTVHCGSGDAHESEINITDSVWDVDEDSYANDVLRAQAGDEDAQWRLAYTLIDWELEDWFDPCEDGGEE